MKFRIIVVALGGTFLYGTFAGEWDSYIPLSEFCPARDCPFYVRDENDWARLVRALATSGPARLPGVNRLRHHDFDCDCDIDLEDVAEFMNRFRTPPRMEWKPTPTIAAATLKPNGDD